MDQAQLDFLVRQVFWALAASWVPARSAACCFLLKVWPRLSSHFLSVATALKTPASVLRLRLAARLAEYDRSGGAGASPRQPLHATSGLGRGERGWAPRESRLLGGGLSFAAGVCLCIYGT
jgi:hypothetical protein